MPNWHVDKFHHNFTTLACVVSDVSVAESTLFILHLTALSVCPTACVSMLAVASLMLI